ncbi:pyrroline-5-carboxylate reductase [Lactobacillus sp. S2-2]|uniref:pyrroline-5-carboxylate reductase n=1 Tax=Lactobacillus sp. S2-2 TaxID=2692917 RepID=UPI001F031293|nr:pyrroline-5-carboxylate reductase [Lactobacillus sp. S2-2]MCF6514643.1 pyrroline-5-carboxylate reductase [Lactobacillus sp. S2-2]
MKIGIMGSGHMGSAIIEGLSNKYPVENLYVYNHRLSDHVKELQNKIQFNLSDQLETFVNYNLDVIFVVTPVLVTKKILNQLNELNSKSIIISAVQGITSDQIKQILPNNSNAITIPNIPVAINQGTIALANSKNYNNPQDEKIINNLLNSLGNVISVDEQNFGIVGTVGGCGPAFVDLFMDALADAQVQNGLDRKTAYKVAASMVSGAGQLAFQKEISPADLKDQVTSPGGSTIKGVVELDHNNFRSTINKAVNAANGTLNN